jgi:hypothetical protein
MKTIRWVATPVETVSWVLDVNGPDGSPSLSKVLAFAFGMVIARDAWRNGFDAFNVSAMGLVCAVALGRSVFMNWLGRNTVTTALTGAITANTNTTLTGDLNKLAEQVLARRDVNNGMEAT